MIGHNGKDEVVGLSGAAMPLRISGSCAILVCVLRHRGGGNLYLNVAFPCGIRVNLFRLYLASTKLKTLPFVSFEDCCFRSLR